MREDHIHKFISLFKEVLRLKNKDYNNDNICTYDPSKTLWNFYIRFKVSEPLGIDCESIGFLDKFIIKSDSSLSLKESNILKLENLEPLIYMEIIDVSKKVEQALILAFAELGVGIAYAENLASEKIVEDIRVISEKAFHKQHTQFYDTYSERLLIHWADKFGVVLFQVESTAWDTDAMQDKNPIDTENLNSIFSDYYEQLQNIDFGDDRLRKIATATSILTTSLFDDSLINRIILSMTAIEVLSTKIERPNDETKVIDDLVEKLNEMDIDNNIKDSLRLGLNSMKAQSIGKSCKVLVKTLLGKKDANKFYDLYNSRSQLVHTGVLKDKEEMYRINMESYSLAKKLLATYINNVSKTPDSYEFKKS